MIASTVSTPSARTSAKPLSSLVSRRRTVVVISPCSSRAGAVPEDDVVDQLVLLDRLGRLHVDRKVHVQAREHAGAGLVVEDAERTAAGRSGRRGHQVVGPFDAAR